METAETQQISIDQVLGTLRKHIGLIFASTFIITLLAALVTFFVITPKYSATSQILVSRKLSDDMAGAQLQQTQADVQMINTYKDIITSPTVLREADEKLTGLPGYKSGVDSLKGSISISSQQNSQVFSINAKSTNPNTAAKMANETAKVFKRKVVKIMNINNVSIVSKAVPNNNPISPRPKLNITAGIVIGFLLGIVLAFLREFSDRTVTSEEFLTEELGLKGLGIISEIDENEIRRKITPKIGDNNSDDGETRMRRRV
ncbi:chain-length determining protein [Pediococcus acidilactici]|uniref:YveK family protein n=2 Tax=Pediococcus acidilactici TaxID=1254 RepID=UPI00132A66A5|nr:Wzz/FepE/Etk N-terminal domain-containing protein [Pediococcus acidilactici]KAF0343780.1 chain-length determining protein [Pediococcus acidilactici]KAF0353599.1 chain-length determining protein [Pediococcus acidilactici]KAF0357935.1 chain-length determining protein [Pediococcus acidilactici]KAF0362097.1 chain-length determining protein [Pediococcus acidilactici]KAF0385565.1 chain-length determining protein [Pediococcus acidilactici]